MLYFRYGKSAILQIDFAQDVGGREREGMINRAQLCLKVLVFERERMICLSMLSRHTRPETSQIGG